MRCHHSTCVRNGDFLYGFDIGRGDLKCIDMKDGVEKWDTLEVHHGTLVLAEGQLITLSEDGTLALVEATPAEFHLRGKLKNVLSGSDCWAMPAVANGKLYIRDHQQVVCLDLRGE
jgi:hypothetical protein